MKIYMYDERSDTIVTSEADLNLKTGEITNVFYTEPHNFFNLNKDVSPCDGYEYEQTTAEFTLKGEHFSFNVDAKSSYYLVNDKELNKIQKQIENLGLNLDEIDSVPKKNKP